VSPGILIKDKVNGYSAVFGYDPGPFVQTEGGEAVDLTSQDLEALFLWVMEARNKLRGF
jgi:hypothetical protein